MSIKMGLYVVNVHKLKITAQELSVDPVLNFTLILFNPVRSLTVSNHVWTLVRFGWTLLPITWTLFEFTWTLMLIFIGVFLRCE
jgi:hypothetical protein